MTVCLALVALAQTPAPLADLPFEFHKGRIWLNAALTAGASLGRSIRFGGNGPLSVVGWDIGCLNLGNDFRSRLYVRPR